MTIQANQETNLQSREAFNAYLVNSIPTEGLSPEDAKAIKELAAELLPFSPIPAPAFSQELVGSAAAAN